MSKKYTQEQVNEAFEALSEVGYNCLTDEQKAIVDPWVYDLEEST